MEKYDIYDIEFIYQEDKLKKNPRMKKRPVLVLGNDILVPVAKITGTNSKTPKTYEIMEWEKAGLTKPSYIIFDRMELQSRRTLTPENYRGHLSDKDIQRIKSLRLGESFDNNINESLEDNNYQTTTTGDIISDSFGNISDEEMDSLIAFYRRLALKLGLKKSESDNIIALVGFESYEIDELKEKSNKIDSVDSKIYHADIYELDTIRYATETINNTNFLYFSPKLNTDKLNKILEGDLL